MCNISRPPAVLQLNLTVKKKVKYSWRNGPEVESEVEK